MVYLFTDSQPSSNYLIVSWTLDLGITVPCINFYTAKPLHGTADWLLVWYKPLQPTST